MNAPRVVTAYERAFAEWVGLPYAFAFWKGRVALYAILRALGIGRGDEVILPGYTCVMNVNPIVYLGARPVYVDIDPRTYNLRSDHVERLITPQTRAIIAQHTYGYPVDMDALLAVAGRQSIPVIEDCCLAQGSLYKGRMVGIFGVAAYWSAQWNKPYTTGLGGMAVTRDADLAARIRQWSTSELEPPRWSEVTMLACQLAAYRALVYPRTTALVQTIFRWLTRHGAVIGSSHACEYSPSMPPGFLKGLSGTQARSGRHQLAHLDRNLRHRRALTRLYDDELDRRGWPRPRPPEWADPVLVRYPVRVADKELALQKAARYGVELGSWFESPLHPKETPLDAYGYRLGSCPAAERACREVVNLPVHPRAGARTVRRTVAFLTETGAPASDATA